jgi:hypothetical protein
LGRTAVLPYQIWVGGAAPPPKLVFPPKPRLIRKSATPLGFERKDSVKLCPTLIAPR